MFCPQFLPIFYAPLISRSLSSLQQREVFWRNIETPVMHGLVPGDAIFSAQILKCFLSSLSYHEPWKWMQVAKMWGVCFQEQSVYGRVHSDAGADFLGNVSGVVFWLRIGALSRRSWKSRSWDMSQINRVRLCTSVRSPGNYQMREGLHSTVFDPAGICGTTDLL